MEEGPRNLSELQTDNWIEQLTYCKPVGGLPHIKNITLCKAWTHTNEGPRDLKSEKNSKLERTKWNKNIWEKNDSKCLVLYLEMTKWNKNIWKISPKCLTHELEMTKWNTNIWEKKRPKCLDPKLEITLWKNIWKISPKFRPNY